MKLKKFRSEMFFGRSVVLLLVVLFSLTGLQMVLAQIGEPRMGVVLGDEDKKNSQGQGQGLDQDRGQSTGTSPQPNIVVTTTPVITPAPAVVIPTAVTQPYTQFAPAGVATPALPPATSVVTVVTTTVTRVPTEVPATARVATPTVIITPEPTTVVTTQPSAPGAPSPVSAPVEVRSSSGNVITTTNEVDRSTNETVRQIISKFGITTAPAPVPVVAPKLQSAVKVVEEKTAGEILSALSTLPSQSGAPQVRLRYKFVNGQMTLVGETDTGQETSLSSTESANIMGKLARSAALDVKPGGTGESVFTKGQIRALTELPLLVDLRTNLLTTETSTGIKTVPLLPDEAIKIAFASKVVDGVYPKKSSAEIAFKEAENGRLVYEVDGLSKRKLFGLVPLTLKETALVDAGNGQVTQPDRSLGQLLIELVAFPIK